MPGRTYYYAVRPYRYYYDVNGVKHKAYGTYGNTTVETTKALTAPSSITAKPSSIDTINLSWKAVTGATGYQVYVSTSLNGTYSLLGTTTTNSYSATKRIPNKTYYFKVRAIIKNVGGTGYGAYGVTVNSKTTLPTPSGFKSSSKTSTTITLAWNRVEGSNIFYEVWRSTDRNMEYKNCVCIGIYGGSTLTCTSKLLKPNTTYYYKIRAYYRYTDSNGTVHKVYTGYSSIISVTTEKS